MTIELKKLDPNDVDYQARHRVRGAILGLIPDSAWDSIVLHPTVRLLSGEFLDLTVEAIRERFSRRINNLLAQRVQPLQFDWMGNRLGSHEYHESVAGAANDILETHLRTAMEEVLGEMRRSIRTTNNS